MHFILIESYDLYSFVSGFFHITLCLLSSFILLYAAIAKLFQSSCTNVYSQQKNMRVPVAPNLWQNFFCVLFYFTHSGGYIIVSQCHLICVFLLANKLENLFIYWLAFWLSSIVKCLFKVLCTFLTWDQCLHSYWFLGVLYIFWIFIY